MVSQQGALRRKEKACSYGCKMGSPESGCGVMGYTWLRNVYMITLDCLSKCSYLTAAVQ